MIECCRKVATVGSFGFDKFMKLYTRRSFDLYIALIQTLAWDNLKSRCFIVNFQTTHTYQIDVEVNCLCVHYLAPLEPDRVGGDVRASYPQPLLPPWRVSNREPNPYPVITASSLTYKLYV